MITPIAAIRRLWSHRSPASVGLAFLYRAQVARRIEHEIRNSGLSRAQAKRATSGAMRALDELGAQFSDD